MWATDGLSLHAYKWLVTRGTPVGTQTCNADRKADRQGFNISHTRKVCRASEEGGIQSSLGERQEVVPPMLKFRHGICRGFRRRDSLSFAVAQLTLTRSTCTNPPQLRYNV